MSRCYHHFQDFPAICISAFITKMKTDKTPVTFHFNLSKSILCSLNLSFNDNFSLSKSSVCFFWNLSISSCVSLIFIISFPIDCKDCFISAIATF